MGRLKTTDRSRVDNHLKICSHCQAELRVERRLQSLISALPDDVIQDMEDQQQRSWHRLEQSILAEPAPNRTKAFLQSFRRNWSQSPEWVSWALAAQLLLLIVGGGFWAWQSQHQSGQRADYHALGTVAKTTNGNAVVLFSPDITEQNLRQILRDHHARIVDGPTVTDAYILNIPAAERDAAIVQLRRQAKILLAEPIDSGAKP